MKAYQAPNMNAYAERFVRSIRSECLDQMILVGQRALDRAIAEYVAHYHAERPHQGLGGRLVAGTTEPSGRGPLARRQRLGGVLNHYYREAA